MLSTALLVLAVIFVAPTVIALMIWIGWVSMIVIATLMEKLVACIK